MISGTNYIKHDFFDKKKQNNAYMLYFIIY